MYTNKIFNWIVLLVSVLFLLDSMHRLTQEFYHFNGVFLRVTLAVSSLLSVLSFFIKKLKGALFSRVFILANLILVPLSIYFQFLVDATMYLAIRFDLISNPLLHVKFLLGLILFYGSIRYSRQSKLQRHNEYGLISMMYGVFLGMLTGLKIVDYDVIDFAILQFILKLMLSFWIVFWGNKLRIGSLNFKKGISIIVLLIFIFTLI